ncbi:MAG: iron ABC transporter permease [Acidimicrobiaceae bacterium]|nr:iron ABC transporter permease [Acidimicrobiaceae bacterium]
MVGDAAEQRHHLVPRNRFGAFMVLLVVVSVLSLAAGIAIGSVTVPLRDVVDVVLDRLWPWYEADERGVNDQIIWEIRTPRALLGFVVGAALSVTGAVLQALVRNPLADPYILGVASGASLGAVTVLVLGSGVAAGLGVSGAAFAGALLALLAVFILGRQGETLVPTKLILAGVALSYVLSSVTSYLQIIAEPNRIQGVLVWLLGTLTLSGWGDLGLPAIVTVLSTGWLLVRARPLNALLMGDEAAASLGVDLRRFRSELLVVSSLLVAVVVAVSGSIGFVGLMIPHIVRMLVGSDHRRLLPAAALLGGSYLVWIDILARSIRRPVEVPLSIITAAIGGPFFLWLMRRRAPRLHVRRCRTISNTERTMT